jgi:hypothetical protein
MKITVTLEKQTENSDPEVWINDTVYTLEDPITTIEMDIEIPTIFRIGRHDDSIYLTADTVLANCVYVREIVIDDFWRISEQNNPSVTIFDMAYADHVVRLPYSYELTPVEHNTAIYFNGSLVYDIPKPVRKMFWS